MEMVFDPIGLL